MLRVEDERLKLRECRTFGYSCPVGDRCTIAELKEKACVSCVGEIRRILSEEGFFVVPAGRTTVVVEPGVEGARTGEVFEGAKIYVLSDPSSGISRIDRLFITGLRFGLTDVVLNDIPVYSVYGHFGSDARYALARLMAIVNGKFLDVNGRVTDEENLKKMQKMLIDIGRELNCRIDERYAFYSTYFDIFDPMVPKRILIVSENDSLLGPIARFALQKAVDKRELGIFVDSAAYLESKELHEFAREVIDKLYGNSNDFKPKSVECLEFEVFRQPVLDYDLIIVLEERFRDGLPEDRTFSLEELTGLRVGIPEDIFEAFEIAEKLEREFEKKLFHILEHVC
ncbi:hypothetical protein [Geoglobus acetivorans]|uniref:Uncharacterized protein n=1 Tax=Geoglobus acetivorans TaxID=565033 RepID=A0ABZ3H2H8_GEOAI|nr:hypothetical protein [Geoglobus acetivorans]